MSVDLLNTSLNAGAILAVLVYFGVLFRRPGWVRVLNNAGLFFTGMAMACAAAFAPGAGEAGAYYAAWGGVFLWLALLAQIASALRGRKGWDGVDWRAPS